MEVAVKQEFTEPVDLLEDNVQRTQILKDVSVIDLSSSSSDSDDDSVFLRKRSGIFDGTDLDNYKKTKFDDLGVVLPLGFLDPLPLEEPFALPAPEGETLAPVSQSLEMVPQSHPPAAIRGCRQFWKAGDYEGVRSVRTEVVFGVMDHVRVHPRFLHSNATSHKWALGAFAELLDNSLDEVCHGATYVNIDVLSNKKDATRMLLVEDNGGGMDPDKMRQCMSLGYSAKSKLANTIGQYGNGFKTSTMRLGADVIVFSRCRGADGKSPTQSIGMLSYTFLRGTGKEDIVVPMLDYEKGGQGWKQLIRTSAADWKRNVESMVHWSPYSSEADLLHQFNYMEEQGTRIIIYNLWEDDQGELELDFDAHPYDIQIRGVNREEKNIEMAKMFPNSGHFLTYRHSLRSYASILYLKLPRGFKMILRGKHVEHHNIVNDMMLTQEITYRPQPGGDGVPKNMVAIVKIGFVKDAKDHIDVQGFNVYHKNRLIKPFWRVWNSTGSHGRGVLGVLEANFIEPAHDKQGFERTTVLQRLETKLIQMQKTYWHTNCHEIGYAPRVNKKNLKESTVKETSSPETHPSRQTKKASSPSIVTHCASRSPDPPYYPETSRHQLRSSQKQVERRDTLPIDGIHVNEHSSISPGLVAKSILLEGSQKKTSTSPQSSGDESSHENQCNIRSSSPNQDGDQLDVSRERSDKICTRAQAKAVEDNRCNINASENGVSKSDSYSLKQLELENQELEARLKILEEMLQFERDKIKSLEAQISGSERRLDDAIKEQEALLDIFSEESNRREKEEGNMRKKLKELLEKQKSTV